MKTVKVKAKSKPKSKTNTKSNPLKRLEYPTTTLLFTYPEITKLRNAIDKFWIKRPPSNELQNKLKLSYIPLYLFRIELDRIIEINKAAWQKSMNKKIPVEFPKEKVGLIQNILRPLIIKEDCTNKIREIMANYDHEAFQSLQKLLRKIEKDQ